MRLNFEQMSLQEDFCSRVRERPAVLGIHPSQLPQKRGLAGKQLAGFGPPGWRRKGRKVAGRRVVASSTSERVQSKEEREASGIPGGRAD